MPTFDRQLARLLLEICRYTYAKSFAISAEINDSLAWIDQHFPGYAKESLEPLNGNGTSVACVFRYPDKNIVSYMGTKTEFKNGKPLDALDSMADWVKNFEAVPVSFELSAAQLGLGQDMALGGLVHEGFLDELQAVQPLVIKALMENGGKGKPLYVTGHSQGGAEATLATRAFQAGEFAVAATYTFAAPRSGDQAYANAFRADIPVHRIEFGDDIVPHVPPILLSKTAQEIVADIKAVQQKISAGTGGFAKFVAAIKAWFTGPELPPELPLKEYIAVLDKFTRHVGFVGIGNLCYGSNETQKLEVDMSAADEAAIFNKRLLHLLSNPKHWADHHHLAGTKAEVKADKKGNYTALVSDFQ
jgi:hypothetical protein